VIGAGARREVIDAVAVAAEAIGFRTLWIGEHVVMVDRSSSRYPFGPDGCISMIVGDNSDAALRRAVWSGHGWYSFNLTDGAHASEPITRLRSFCDAAGRDPVRPRDSRGARPPTPAARPPRARSARS